MYMTYVFNKSSILHSQGEQHTLAQFYLFKPITILLGKAKASENGKLQIAEGEESVQIVAKWQAYNHSVRCQVTSFPAILRSFLQYIYF